MNREPCRASLGYEDAESFHAVSNRLCCRRPWGSEGMYSRRDVHGVFDVFCRQLINQAQLPSKLERNTYFISQRSRVRLGQESHWNQFRIFSESSEAACSSESLSSAAASTFCSI